MNIRIDDIFAAILLSMIMFRRLEVLTTTPQDNPHVEAEAFAAWRTRALSAHNLAAVACIAKVVLSVGWFYVFAQHDLALRLGGLTIFVAWVTALVIAWRRATEARALRSQLGINSPSRGKS